MIIDITIFSLLNNIQGYTYRSRHDATSQNKRLYDTLPKRLTITGDNSYITLQI